MPFVLGQLVKFQKKCQAAAGTNASLPAIQAPPSTLLDRDHETRRLREIFDNRNLRLVIVSGLVRVGKRTVTGTALAQSGRTRVYVLELLEDSTPQFVIASLLRLVDLPLPNSISGISW